jgi:spatacsin
MLFVFVLIDLFCSVEKRFYPSSSFWDTYLGRENVIHDAANIVTLPGEDKPVLTINIYNHPAIECGDVDGAVLGSWVNVNDYTDLKEFSQSNLSDGYWACAAVWSDAWDQRTVDRVSHDLPFHLLTGGLHLISDSNHVL